MILVINCGSSSVKYQLFEIRKNGSLARGAVERIGRKDAFLTHQAGRKFFKSTVLCRNHHAAIDIIAGTLADPKHGVIRSRNAIKGIGHRVVHGGEKFKESTLITWEVIESIRRYSELAPLHNPPALAGIKACAHILRGVPQVAVFDTSFHQTMPIKAFLYGLPFKYYKRYGIRKYGFHGTSHRFVASRAPLVLRRSAGKLKLVTCHLGNGCSMAAIDRGRSVDTTMGFTPLEGLLMGTRSGDLDPAVVFYLMKKERLSADRISDLLNRESGLLGVSGVSNDMRDIVKSSKLKSQSSKRAKLALEIFIYRIEKYIGAYHAAMGGLDAVIFTAGISENQPWLIRRIAGDMRNVVGAGTKFIVIPTNEELLIAEDTSKLINCQADRKATN